MLTVAMRVHVIPFGVLKDWLGAPADIDLPPGATVADLLSRLSARPAAPSLRGIAVGVNAEFAAASRVLHDGDEVALLPPVSGGTSRPANLSDERSGKSTTVALVRERIDTEKLVTAARKAEDGAVVVFDGIVRNHSRGRATLHLDYEAYEQMALRQVRELAAEACRRFAVRHATLVHRLGRLEIGETSVLVVVASAHRAPAFEACRWLIDTLKQTVPIWKKETFVDGAVWAPGEPFPQGLAVDSTEAERED